MAQRQISKTWMAVFAAAIALTTASASHAQSSGGTNVGEFILRVFGFEVDRPVQAEAVAEVAEVPQESPRKTPATPAVRLLPAIEIAPATRQEPAKEADLKTTHTKQVELPIVDSDGKTTSLHTFCLAKSGNILAGCGTPDEGHIRVFEPEGKYITRWKLPVVPEAINVDPSGNIVVAGEGKLLKLDSEGAVILEKEAPHVAAMLASRDQIKEQIVTQHKARSTSYARTLKIYDDQIAKLTEKTDGGEELTPAETQRLSVYKRARESMAKMVEQQQKQGLKELTDEQIESQVKSMVARKSQVSSISSTGKEVFIACGMPATYGYQVFRMDGEFDGAVSIIQDLRGCCGQMDVQVNQTGVFVAENSRHRVAHFDLKGEAVGDWGGRDRTGEKGFSSCCNPMNVCFGSNNTVLTAESTTGLIKQFDVDGKLVAHVAKVKLVPGCKKVSIAISPDGERVYMMDITRRHIVMLTRPTTDNDVTKAAATTRADAARTAVQAVESAVGR